MFQGTPERQVRLFGRGKGEAGRRGKILVLETTAMKRAPWTFGSALLFGLVTEVAVADARPADPHPKAAPAPVAKERPISWKLWVGKKTFDISARGGTAPLPKGTNWECRYSGTAREANKRNLKQETVTMTCSSGSAQFNLSTTCSAPIDPHKNVEEGVMPSEFQHVMLGGRIFLGLSCDVPGFELRTYRKK
jgi:hypothetical protein